MVDAEAVAVAHLPLILTGLQPGEAGESISHGTVSKSVKSVPRNLWWRLVRRPESHGVNERKVEGLMYLFLLRSRN